MRALLRTLARALGTPSAQVVLAVLRLTGHRQGIAVVYHGLAGRSGDPRTALVAPHGLDLAEAQLRFLARHFDVVAADELQAAAAGRRRGRRFPAAVTFDDDLASHVHAALPLLQRQGVPATFFLTGATLDAPSPFWWQRLQRAAERDPALVRRLAPTVGAEPGSSLPELARHVEQLDEAALRVFEEQLESTSADGDPGLRADEIRALRDAGMGIGFHTRRHQFLPRLPDDELAAALDEGRSELEQAAGQRLAAIAYPHGVADGRVAAAARAAGFSVGYTGRPQPVLPDDDSLLLGRLDPSHASLGQFGLQLVLVLLRRR